MTHDEATDSMAAERYILGELEPSERDAFEDHFFECDICADDVRDEAAIGDGVRKMRLASPKHYSRWATAAAAAAVAIGLTYQYAPQQIARFWHRTPAPIGVPAHVTDEQVIELDAPRAATTTQTIRADRPVSLYFIIPPPDQPPPSYTCTLRDDAGHIVTPSKTVTQKEAADTVAMPLSTGALHSGHYTLEIRGGDREIVTTYPFTVEVR